MNDLNLMVTETTKEQTHPCGAVTTTNTREIFYDGCTVERGGYTFRINFPRDDDHEPPWEDGEGQGIVREVPYGDNKHPGERVLHHNQYSRTKRLFDWSGTIAKAKEEGWGIDPDRLAEWTERIGKPPTRNQVIEAAVQSNFLWMRRWLREEWEYVGIKITLLRDGNEVTSETAWGFSNNDAADLSLNTHWMIDQMLGEVREHAAFVAKKALEQEAADIRAAKAVTDLHNAIIWSHFSESFKRDLYAALIELAERAGTPYQPQ